MNKLWGHFKTITAHKLAVTKLCFRCGLYKQGLLHDLSKYTPVEFCAGVKYFQGNRSPIDYEKEVKGYSLGWLHHKGRNKHHFEYWIDVSLNKEEGLVGNKMPVNYVAEMLCDRIAACEVYRGKNYTSAAPMEYYEFTKKYITIHPETRALLEKLLTILKDGGEESAYAYIRKLLKKGSY